MAKSKNHTNHNQSKLILFNDRPLVESTGNNYKDLFHFNYFPARKAHRNGIKKPKRYRHESTMGVSILFL